MEFWGKFYNDEVNAIKRESSRAFGPPSVPQEVALRELDEAQKSVLQISNELKEKIAKKLGDAIVHHTIPGFLNPAEV